jgi:hypothetical protein
LGKLDKQISIVENEAKCLIPSVVRKLENLEKTVDQDSSTNEDFRKVRNDIGFKNSNVKFWEKKFALCATKKINILNLVLSEKKILNEAINHNHYCS